MSELALEYSEGLYVLGHRGLVFYKFMNMFSVKVREEDALIKFGPLLTCTTTRIEDAERIRAYLKEQKEWIRQQGTTATSRDMLSRMWWTLQKMVDYGFWSIQDQRYIVYWHDTCADQFTTP